MEKSERDIKGCGGVSTVLKKVVDMADLNLHIELALQKYDEFIDSLEEESASGDALEGPYELDSQSTYFGQIRDGRPNGFGEEIRVDGDVYYAGFWKEGRKMGKCLLAFMKNSFFLNKNFEDSEDIAFILNRSDDGGVVTGFNCYNGRGYMELVNGKNFEKSIFQYKGEFKNSLLDGEGSVHIGEGVKLLQGKFSKGEITKGVVFDKNGIKQYRGDFVNSLPHGLGTSYDNRGKKVFQGKFSEGFFFENKKIFFTTGELLYEGEIQGNIPEGKGKLYCKAEQAVIYEGFFKNGKKEGEGEEFKDGKIVYRGQFKDGKRHGMGEIFGKNGEKIYKGKFIRGKIDQEECSDNLPSLFQKPTHDSDTQDGEM